MESPNQSISGTIWRNSKKGPKQSMEGTSISIQLNDGTIYKDTTPETMEGTSQVPTQFNKGDEHSGLNPPTIGQH